MSESVRSKVLKLIKTFPDRFVWYERLVEKSSDLDRVDVDVALFTLCKSGVLTRITNGIYYYKGRKKSPCTSEIAEIIALKNNWSISATDIDNIFLANTPRTKKYTVTGGEIIFRQTSIRKLKKFTGSKNNKGNYQYLHNTKIGDEQYSPRYIVEPLIQYIKKLSEKLKRPTVIWCPADTAESNYYKVLSKNPFCKVITTHISTGQDFYTFEPDFEFDCIITNPPFSNKKKWFERTLSFGKPFALLLPLGWLNDKTSHLDGKNIQLLIPDKRTQFIGSLKEQVPFKAVYYCKDFLPSNLETCSLHKNGER